jgi:Kdo2-lipid IVA lauroyltransferase/acyltransferase
MKVVKHIFNYLGLGFLYLLNALPITVNHAIGDVLGWIAYHLPIERKKVVDINLKLCFPHLSDSELKKLALKHWQLFGRSITERGYLWLGSEAQIEKLVQVKSDIDMADGKSRLFFSMHLLGIEAGLIGISLYLNKRGLQSPITLYIKMKNDFFDQKIKHWRERFGGRMILRQQNAREMIRAIRSNQAVAISPDMDLGIQDSVFVPFFGVPTCTVTSISRMAKIVQTEVCPVITTLNPDGKSYTVHIGKPLENFPTDDEVADTLRLNQFFEAQIIPRPEEYYWVHKRFKNRPEGQARFYS